MNFSSESTICVEGLPAAYTWRHVKDLARVKASRGIRTNSAYKTNATGEQVAVHLISVGNRNEAHALFDWLAITPIEGRHLTIHLFQDAVCQRSNCHLMSNSCSFCSRAMATAQSAASGVAAGSFPLYEPPVQAYSQRGPFSPYSVEQMPPQVMSMDGFSPHPFALVHPSQHAHQVQSTPHINPKYLRSASRQPAMADHPHPWPSANAISDGHDPSGARSVCIENLPSKIKAGDLQQLLAGAGQILSCSIDRRANKSHSRIAVVMFSTANEAANAIWRLNNFTWQGCELRARYDQNVGNVPATSITTAIPGTLAPDTTYPIIAKGTMQAGDPADWLDHLSEQGDRPSAVNLVRNYTL